eukprot:6211381-Pleurochrysis_carterae.AAC.2
MHPADVSIKYVADYSACQPVRADDAWWDTALAAAGRAWDSSRTHTASAQNEGAGESRTVEAFSGSAGTSTAAAAVGPSTGANGSRAAAMESDATSIASATADARRAAAEEQARLLASQPLPPSLAAIKKHPLYVLERDLGKYEVIHPTDTRPVGICKGLRVYPRSCAKQVKVTLELGKQSTFEYDQYDVICFDLDSLVLVAQSSVSLLRT